MNAKVNSFMETKKLELNPKKCSQIHIGHKCNQCPKLKVHNSEMKKVDQEKYLGDIVHKNCKPSATIVERISKGHGIVTNISALIKDIPLGNRRVQIGLDLRQAWFINGLLYNSEVWQQMTKNEENDLCKLDQHLLRVILGAHSKVPLEMLYLETGTLPIPKVISIRRLMYLQEIVKRQENELVSRVYTAMKEEPQPSDWCELVKQDFENINLHISENLIKQMSKKEYKDIVSNKVRESTFKSLRTLQESHQKVKDIEFTQLKTSQEYITNNNFSNAEISLLFNLRCKTVKGIKKNFTGMYGSDSKCELCGSCEDSQEHILECTVLEEHMVWDHSIQYQYLFGSVDQQKLVITLFTSLLELRQQLLEERRPTGAHSTGPTVV